MENSGEELFPEVRKMPLFWVNVMATEKIVINQGGTSSGKSHALIRAAFFHCIFPESIIPPEKLGAGLKAEVVASTFPKLMGDTLEIAENLYYTNKHLQSFISSYHQTKHTFFFHNGSKLVFKAYEKPKDAEGPKRDVLYINECRNLPWPTANKLILRTNYKAYLDYNPTQQFWVHDRIINCPVNGIGEKEFESVKVIRSWHIHNQFISDSKRREIENISDPELWKAYARGLTAKVSGLVYPNWVRLPNDAIPENKDDCYWGVDYGYTNDPTALVRVFENVNYGGVVYDYLFDEIIYTTGTPSGFIYQKLIENGYKSGQLMYSEHDKTIVKELRTLGITAILAIKGDVEPGILHLRSSRCAFTDRSNNIAEEQSRYSFATNVEGKETNKPEDRFNHAMDACRYAAFTNAIRRGRVKHHIAVNNIGV